MKIEVRKDSATAPFDVIQLILSLVATLPMRMGLVDITGSTFIAAP